MTKKAIPEERAKSPTSISLLARLEVLKKVLPKGGTVLEVGCGNGFISREIIDRGAQLTAIDYSEEAIKNARKLNLEGKFIVADIYKFKPQGKFDFIICAEVLEHMPDDEKALRLMFNWLKPGGKLILTVPISKFNERARKYGGHLRHYKASELTTRLRKLGFRIEKSHVWGSFIRHFILTRIVGTRLNRPTQIPKFLIPFVVLVVKLDILICPMRYNLQLVLKKERRK